MKRYEHNFGKNPLGALSTVSGYATETTNFGETAFGILNKSTRDKNNFTTPEVVSSSTATLFSVGNGTDTDNRKNIIELKADGTVFISGVGGYDGTNPGDSKDISKELQSVHDDIDNINLDIDRIDSDIDSIHVELDSDLVYTFIVKGENRGTINIPRDQFLKDVNYNEETNILEFLFIVRNEENEEEQKVVKIDMTDLEDIYTNGDGLNLENKKFSIKIDADTQPYIDVSPNGLKIIGVNEALDTKVDWQENKTSIYLPTNGSITALRNDGQGGGVLICQRSYDGEATYVTEVGTTMNNLTLNSIERPKIDFAGGTSENVAYESEVKSLQDRMSTAETDIDNLEGRMDTAEGDIDTILSDLSELIGDGEGSVQDQIKTALEDYLPLSGGTMTGNITFGSESAPDTNGHEYVDLGLPSGNLWAKCNIGANTEEEAGLYFQWGDTQGYTAEQVGDGEGLKAFRWADYKFSIDGSDRNFSKYNVSDSKTVLDPEDDAAHVNMGGSWRMPTFEEWKELCFNTDIYLVPTEGEEIQGTAQEDSGFVIINLTSQAEGTLKGVKFYKKGDKQTYMFVPESGNAYVGAVQDVGGYGGLLASSLDSSGVQGAWSFGFYPGGGYISAGGRCYGIPVRGIFPKSDSTDYTGGIIISGKSDTDLVNAVGGTTTIDSIREGLATEDALNEYKTSNDEKIQSIEDKLDQEIEAGNTDKETIDNYTVNGHKISENPVLTKTDVGLNLVDNVQQIPMSMKGQAGGVAELDANGKVPSSQLDGQLAHVFGVDGVVANQSALPTEGVIVGDIYYTTEDPNFYNYNGTSWDAPMAPKDDTIYNFRNSDATGDTSRTNILYRWDGATLVEISESLALGEVAGTAYEGNKGAANKAAIGTNTYTGANYISKETNLTDAVLQLDEEIKATNDNLALEHTNAEATYAKKTDLNDYLPLSGGQLNGDLSVTGHNRLSVDGSIWIENVDPRNSRFFKILKGTNLYLIHIPSHGQLAGEFSSDTESCQMDCNSITFEKMAGSTPSKESIINFNGFTISDKTSSDLLHAAGGTISVDDIIAKVPEPDLSPYATKEELDDYLPITGGYIKESSGAPAGSKLYLKSDRVEIGDWSDTKNYFEVRKGYLRFNSYNVLTQKETQLNLTSHGISISDKTSSDLLNAARGTVSIQDIIAQANVPTNVSQLTNDAGYQTESQVAAKVASLVDSAPETLDTLNELAAALGDDPNFATTVTNQIASKQDKLVSGTNIKTINNQSIVGSGNIEISDKQVTASTADSSGGIYRSVLAAPNGTNSFTGNPVSLPGVRVKMAESGASLLMINDSVLTTGESPTNDNISAIVNRGFGINAGTNDQFVITAGGHDDEGFGLIAMLDNNDDPIYVCNVDTSNYTVHNLITLLDESGNQKFNDVTANKFIGNLQGNAATATKATQDASGNVITDTYAKKSDIVAPTVKAASGTLTLWTGTETEYNDIATKDPNTLYFILES